MVFLYSDFNPLEEKANGEGGRTGGSGAFKLDEYLKAASGRPVYAYSGALALINCLLRRQKKEIFPVAYVELVGLNHAIEYLCTYLPEFESTSLARHLILAYFIFLFYLF